MNPSNSQKTEHIAQRMYTSLNTSTAQPSLSRSPLTPRLHHAHHQQCYRIWRERDEHMSLHGDFNIHITAPLVAHLVALVLPLVRRTSSFAAGPPFCHLYSRIRCLRARVETQGLPKCIAIQQHDSSTTRTAYQRTFIKTPLYVHTMTHALVHVRKRSARMYAGLILPAALEPLRLPLAFE